MQRHIYQNIYDKDYTIVIPTDASELTLANAEGDWGRLSELGITLPGEGQQEDIVALHGRWGVLPADLKYAHGSAAGAFACADMLGADALYREKIGPWRQIGDSGVGVHIGEFGVFNKTPHDVTLRRLEDTLRLLKENGMGWALWNFRGSFGVLDSGRSDVDYVDFEGHKLDRAMLELLQRYWQEAIQKDIGYTRQGRNGHGDPPRRTGNDRSRHDRARHVGASASPRTLSGRGVQSETQVFNLLSQVDFTFLR